MLLDRVIVKPEFGSGQERFKRKERAVADGFKMMLYEGRGEETNFKICFLG